MLQNILSITAILLTASLLLYILFRKERTLNTYAFFSALFFTLLLELFDLLSLNYPGRLLLWKKFALISESLLPLSWLLFSSTFSRTNGARHVSALQRALLFISPIFLFAAIFVPVESFFYSPDFESEMMLFLGKQGFVFYIGVLIYMIASLINLESTLLTASRTERWKIKLEIIGAGCLIAMLIFYYSQGLLYRSINMSLMPARSIIIILSVALMAYSRIKRGNGVKIYVSKQMAYRSVVIFIVGLYLIWLGLIGEGMKYFGGTGLKVMLTSLAFLIGIAMVIALFSETINRKIKVLIHKNFYPSKYDYRSQWLRFTDRLSSARTDDELLNAIVSGFAETFAMEGSALFLYDKDREVYFCAALFEMDTADKTFAKNDSFIKFMKSKKWIANLSENISEIKDEKEFFEKNGMAFVIPLFSNGDVEGFIALAKPINKKEVYTYEDYDLMKTLAKQAFSAVLNLRLADELSRAREMEAIGKISAFVIHDLKNLASTLSLIVDNAKNHIENHDFQNDMLLSLSNTVKKMKRMISRLNTIEEKKSLNYKHTDLYKMVNDVAGMVTAREIAIEGGPVFSDVDVEEIQKVVLNLILNAIEATENSGAVTVKTGCKEDAAFISVSDEGCGISDEFIRKNLFKPFRTTKSKGLGIGVYQCKQIVEAHGGRIDVESEVGKGTLFTVRLPLAKRAEFAMQE